MVQSILLATSVVFGLLGSTQAQSNSAIDKDSVNLLLLGKEIPTARVTGSVLEVSATRTVYYVECEPLNEQRVDGEFVNPCPLIGGSVTQEPTRWEYDVRKQTQDIRGTGLGTFTAETTRSTYVSSLIPCLIRYASACH